MTKAIDKFGGLAIRDILKGVGGWMLIEGVPKVSSDDGDLTRGLVLTGIGLGLMVGMYLLSLRHNKGLAK